MKTILSAIQTWTKGKIKESTADWNQNDSNADNYVKNRTHWEEDGVVHKLDFKYLPDDVATINYVDDKIDDITEIKMDKNNPVGTGSFSMNKSECQVGDYSSSLGLGTISGRKSQNVNGEYNSYEPPYVITTINSTDKITFKRLYYSNSYELDLVSGEIKLVNPSYISAVNSTSSNRIDNKYVIANNGSGAVMYYLTFGKQMGTNTDGSFYVSPLDGGTFTKYTPDARYKERGDYVYIVGNGTSDTARSNAHTLDWEGNAWYQGDVYVGSTSGTNKDSGSKKLATEEYVDANSILTPVIAQVGQILSVKAVDENGKPTEWEAVDFSSGGGYDMKIHVWYEENDDNVIVPFGELLEGSYESVMQKLNNNIPAVALVLVDYDIPNDHTSKYYNYEYIGYWREEGLECLEIGSLSGEGITVLPDNTLEVS